MHYTKYVDFSRNLLGIQKDRILWLKVQGVGGEQKLEQIPQMAMILEMQT